MEKIYEPNSHKSKQEKANAVERPRPEKVVNGPVRTKKKSGVGKFFSGLVSDEVSNIKTHIVTDVIFPTIKDVISKTVDTILYGDSSRRNKGIATKISYNNMYATSSRPREEVKRQPTGYEDVVVGSRGEAEAVLEQLEDMIQQYGWARISDLYDLVGLSCPYTCNSYGWDNIASARVQRTRDGGFVIEMPKAIPLK